jgi:outer membrane protein insertion porin family
MGITFRVAETPRVYVERINIQGNTVTRDKVIRREFRLNEGDAFNAFKVKRSQDRIQNLGFFQENLEIKQAQGTSNDRVVLNVDVEEKSTGELQLSAGFSSLEKFIISASVAQRNFMGKGQILQTGVNYSRYSKSIQAGFTEPYLFDKNILLGGELFYRDYSSFNYDQDGDRNQTYGQKSIGGITRLGFPVTEYVTFGTRYSLVQDDITLDEDIFFDDVDNDPDTPDECDPDEAGRYLCNELGKKITSSIGYTVAYDNTNGIRATRGHRLILSQDFAGLGGDVKYLRTRGDATKYFGLPAGFILSVHGEGGYIHPLQDSPGADQDAIRLTDRFFGPQMRGFDIRGIGPRVVSLPYENETTVDTASEYLRSDAIGGRAYYMGRIEVEFPISSSLRSLGLRPSAFVDVGSVWNLVKPELTNRPGSCTQPDDGDTDTSPQIKTIPVGNTQTCEQLFGTGSTYNLDGFREFFLGNSAKPRLSVGIGVNWVSPFGPLRIDIAKALMTQEGDETKLFSFNVGTQF